MLEDCCMFCVYVQIREDIEEFILDLNPGSLASYLKVSEESGLKMTKKMLRCCKRHLGLFLSRRRINSYMSQVSQCSYDIKGIQQNDCQIML